MCWQAVSARPSWSQRRRSARNKNKLMKNAAGTVPMARIKHLASLGMRHTLNLSTRGANGFAGNVNRMQFMQRLVLERQMLRTMAHVLVFAPVLALYVWTFLSYDPHALIAGMHEAIGSRCVHVSFVRLFVRRCVSACACARACAHACVRARVRAVACMCACVRACVPRAWVLSYEDFHWHHQMC